MRLRAPAPIATLARRLVAFFLDGLILVPVYLVYAVALDALLGPLVEPDPAGSGVIVVAVDPLRVVVELTLTILTDAAYYAGSWVLWGTTPGQRICGVAVRAVAAAAPPGAPAAGAPERNRVPASVATTRWAILQLLVLCTGTLGAAGAIPLGVVAGVNSGWYAFLFVTAALDPLRRGLHDRGAGTIVVRAPTRRRG